MKTDAPHADGATVRIFDGEYHIAGDIDAAELERVAAYVNRKMEEVAVRSPRIRDRTRLAVLAAMEITVQLLQAQHEKDRLIQQAHENISRLNRSLDQRTRLVSLTTEWLDQRARPQAL